MQAKIPAIVDVQSKLASAATLVASGRGSAFDMGDSYAPGLGGLGIQMPIPITAASFGGAQGVNAVKTLDFVDSTGSGTFTLPIEGVTTAAITYSSTNNTLKTNIQAALDTAFGTNQIVVSGSAITAVVLTFSGSKFKSRNIDPITLVAANTAGLTSVVLTAADTTEGTPAYSFRLEDSPDGFVWRRAGASTPVVATDVASSIVLQGFIQQRYVRLAYTFTGSSNSITIGDCYFTPYVLN